MSSDRGLRPVLAAAALFAGAALALTGCGKQGVLEQPPPLFGARAKADYEAQKAQEARDAAQRAAQRANSEGSSAGDNAPASRSDVKDPAQKLTPASAAPLPGASNLGGTPVSPRPSN